MDYWDKVDFIEELWSFGREDIISENREWAIESGAMSAEEFDEMLRKCEKIHFHRACAFS